MENIHTSAVVFKIMNATPRSDVNLCPSCVNSHIYTLRSGETSAQCVRNFAKPINLRDAVVSCNGYLDRTQPSLSQMMDIAWALMTDKGGRKLGFVAPDRDKHSSPPIGF